MTKPERDKLRERIAQGINHGLDDAEIIVDLAAQDIRVSRPTLIAIIRDLVNCPTN